MQVNPQEASAEKATTGHDVPPPIERARAWIEQNALILDTETTGLDDTAQIVEITLIDCEGKVLMDTLVRPSSPIPADASAIHGISDDLVANAPSWTEVHHQFLELVAGRPVVIYNADYDTRIINQTNAAYGLPGLDLDARCAMLTYAQHWGQWDGRRGNWKWQRLTSAAEQQGVLPVGQAHRSLADCRMTLGIIRAMAQGGAQ